jgi:tyrosine decarboxylase / aspartate 1-decarboxylase
MLEKESLHVLSHALDSLDDRFGDLPPFDAEAVVDSEFETILVDVAQRLGNELPYFHPLYAGQMLKSPHPIARAVYSLALWLNPNNHALDASRASSPMEKEAVAEMARMVGWDTHLGHLTGGGTMANLEALWVAGQLKPGALVVASRQAHYTHQRISAVLNLPFEPIDTDRFGRMDLKALEQRLRAGDVGTVVATIGSTATGSVDPLEDLLALRDRYGFRLHGDGAYGGYFTLAPNLGPQTAASFDRLSEADSIVIDPHKHGLQPYGCGCVLFRDPSVGRFYKHDSPYTYFTSGELHLGEISLECSRPGAAAVALWATQRLLPLVRGGRFAELLSKSRDAGVALYDLIDKDPRFLTPFAPELDIVVWTVNASSAGRSSELARRVFDETTALGLHLALAEIPTAFYSAATVDGWANAPMVTSLRSVLMKPEHKEWIGRIGEMLDQAVSKVV